MFVYYSSLILLLFVFGFTIMSLEILSSRLMAPYFGGSIYIWGSIISTYMVHMALGYLLGGYASKLTRKLFPVLTLLAIGSFWVILIPWLHKPLGFWISEAITDVRLGSILCMNLLFVIPIVTMAMVSPYIIGLWSIHRKQTGLSAGLVLFISTLGSFAGTILTAFYSIDFFRVSHIIRTIGVVCLLVSLIILALRIDRYVKESGTVEGFQE
ncbi:MAG: fused MFS/spermidine synthase [Deltaproteobacteria bacterium]|nr:fused MFS/spermidine synthase [Deltaproteobacteria bacterium]